MARTHARPPHSVGAIEIPCAAWFNGAVRHVLHGFPRQFSGGPGGRVVPFSPAKTPWLTSFVDAETVIGRDSLARRISAIPISIRLLTAGSFLGDFRTPSAPETLHGSGPAASERESAEADPITHKRSGSSLPNLAVVGYSSRISKADTWCVEPHGREQKGASPRTSSAGCCTSHTNPRFMAQRLNHEQKGASPRTSSAGCCTSHTNPRFMAQRLNQAIAPANPEPQLALRRLNCSRRQTAQCAGVFGDTPFGILAAARTLASPTSACG